MGTSRDSAPPAKKARLSTADSEADGVKLRACNVVSLVPVASAAEVDGKRAEGYEPKYLHQVFTKEEVVGYAAASLRVLFDPVTLATCLEEELSGGAEGATPPSTTVARKIRDGLCEDVGAFKRALEERPASPLTSKMATYALGGKSYGVFREALRGDALKAFHKRIEFFMYLYIESASFIAINDARWQCYYVAALDEDGKPADFVGYATTYPFSAMCSGSVDTFRERLRVSQVLIMPQHRGCGHGGRLLRCIYATAASPGRDVLEVTVEDPSYGFRTLRDLVDLRRAYARKLLPYGEQLPLGDADKCCKEIHEELRITAGQARRIFELHAFANVDDNEEAVKELRLFVKRRLFAENVEVLDHLDKKVRKERLADIYNEYAKEYKDVLERLEKRGIAMPPLHIKGDEK